MSVIRAMLFHMYVLFVVMTIRSFPHWWLARGIVTRVTRRACLHFQSTQVHPRFQLEVRVAQYLVLCICFVYHCFSICPLSFGHCVVFPSSNYGFWSSLWYLQTFIIAHCIAWGLCTFYRWSVVIRSWH